MVSPGDQMKAAFEARLREVAGEEDVIAAGTADEAPGLDGDVKGGQGWCFLLVTQRRVLFGKWSGDTEEEIVFADVGGWSDGEQYHRYVLVIEHGPLTRLEWAPTHKLFSFKRSNSKMERTRSQTIFVFSHRETAVAKALRERLGSVERKDLNLQERTRADRTAGSHFVLRATRREEP